MKQSDNNKCSLIIVVISQTTNGYDDVLGHLCAN